MRVAEETRGTAETKICVKVNLDGTGQYNIRTGLGFFDHMLEQLAKHSLVDIDVQADGDLHIDCHHTIEDVAIVLGTVFKKAVGDKKGIRRYGSAVVVMDEARSRVDLDFSGRSYCVWNAKFTVPRIGAVDTELIPHFFDSFAKNAGLTLHVQCDYGDNNHHICESIFKATAKALRQGLEHDERMSGILPSTKGTL
jgi:imidazoleglycerol-phosphate dehydratase